MSKTIAEIKREFEMADNDRLSQLFADYAQDGRAGVVGLLAKYKKKQQDLEKERIRLDGMRAYERTYEHLGYVCGVDEAGRGPLAGPVVAGAVILPKDCEILYLNDSKQLSEKKRELLYQEIMEKALAVGVGMASPARIDEINILQATYEAMRKAVRKLSVRPQILIIKGDAKSVSIAAASIIAKVTRDRLMREYDRIMPEYGFAGHKGYGSKDHMRAIREYGPSPIHRKTFIHAKQS